MLIPWVAGMVLRVGSHGLHRLTSELQKIFDKDRLMHSDFDV